MKRAEQSTYKTLKFQKPTSFLNHLKYTSGRLKKGKRRSPLYDCLLIFHHSSLFLPVMICHLLILLFPVISISQYYNPSLYQSYMNAGVPRQQTVLVPVYTQGGYGGAYGGYPSYGQSYGQSYPSYGMGMGYGYAAGYPMMGGAGGACCGGTGMGVSSRIWKLRFFSK